MTMAYGVQFNSTFLTGGAETAIAQQVLYMFKIKYFPAKETSFEKGLLFE